MNGANLDRAGRAFLPLRIRPGRSSGSVTSTGTASPTSSGATPSTGAECGLVHERGNLVSWASLLTVTDQNWTIVGTGDFNDDGKPDIILRNTSSGQDVVWYMNGATLTSWANLPAVADQTWAIVGTGDFNEDGKPDIVWRNTSTGAECGLVHERGKHDELGCSSFEYRSDLEDRGGGVNR